MSSSPQSFKLAQSARILANFSSQLQQQQQLLGLIKSILPENLAKHAQYCVISDNRVLIYTDNAIWASQLRFYHFALLEAITNKDRYAHIEFVHFRILVINNGLPTPRTPNIPSLKTTHLIRHSIHGTDKDPLKQAVNNLCRTLENAKR